MTEQQKATTADETIASRVVSQAVLQAAYENRPTCQWGVGHEFIAGWTGCLEYLARTIATPQPADVSQARPAQEDAPVADGTNWREVASRLNAALLSNDASHAEQARRIYVRALLAATDKAIARSLGAHLR